VNSVIELQVIAVDTMEVIAVSLLA
jgi:hypothetical protein